MKSKSEVDFLMGTSSELAHSRKMNRAKIWLPRAIEQGKASHIKFRILQCFNAEFYSGVDVGSEFFNNTGIKCSFLSLSL